MIRCTLEAEESLDQEKVVGQNESTYNQAWISRESSQEFDLANESKQGDEEKCLPIHHQGNNKASQPTGARKRKGKLRIQCKLVYFVYFARVPYLPLL